jgi:hypothetical protein
MPVSGLIIISYLVQDPKEKAKAETRDWLNNVVCWNPELLLVLFGFHRISLVFNSFLMTWFLSLQPLVNKNTIYYL